LLARAYVIGDGGMKQWVMGLVRIFEKMTALFASKPVAAIRTT
jgi:hypothetical protein